MERNIQIKPTESYRNWNEIKKVEVNFDFKNNKYGCIFPVMKIRSKFDRAFKLGVLIVRNLDELEKGIPKRIDIVGMGRRYEINEDSKIIVDVEPSIDTDLFSICRLHPYIKGFHIDGTVSDFKLHGFYLAGPSPLISLSRYVDGPKTI